MYPATADLIDRVLKRTHTQRVKIESLNEDLTIDRDVTTKVVAGSVQVRDSNEGARTFQITVSNKNGELTPRTFADAYQLTRKLRIWRGVVLATATEWVPLGTFQVTRAKPRLRSGESVIDVAGIDLWFKLRTTFLSTVFTITAGTSLSDAIASVLALAKLTSYIIDARLKTLIAGGYTADTAWQTGTPTAIVMSQLLMDSGATGRFDVLGTYVVSAFTRLDETTPVLALSDVDHPGITSIEPTAEDSPDIANVVIVATTSPDVTPFQVQVSDDRDGSLTRASGPFGRRVAFISDDAIETKGAATEVGYEALYDRSYGALPLDLRSVPLPFLDVRDVLSITSARLNLAAAPYAVDELDIPLEPGEMSARLVSVRDLGAPVPFVDEYEEGARVIPPAVYAVKVGTTPTRPMFDTSKWTGTLVDTGAGAQNDEIGWYIWMRAGTHTLHLRYVTNTNKGIASIRIDDVEVATQDFYAASPAVGYTEYPGIVVAASSLKKLSLKMATKNASSSGYGYVLDSVGALRTA